MKTKSFSVIAVLLAVALVVSAVLAFVLRTPRGEYETPHEEDEYPGFVIDNDGVYLLLQEVPEYQGGHAAMQDFIRKNMIYPVDAIKDSIQGRVLVQFIVEKDGTITNPQVLKSVHPLLDSEAVRITQQMPKWIPGRQDGDTVRAKWVIPVNFRLDAY